MWWRSFRWGILALPSVFVFFLAGIGLAITMSSFDQPLEPDTRSSLTSGGDGVVSDAAGKPMLGDIPVVDAEEIRASIKSSRIADVVRCDVHTAIASLSTLHRGRIVIITPDSESNLGCAVAMARALSEMAPTIVVDMAADSRSSHEMLSSFDKTGLKDVLAGESKVSDSVFSDLRSAAHIMPSGQRETQLNPESIKLLPIVLDALQQKYKYVLLDVGGAHEKSLSRIADENTGIVVVTGERTNEEVNDRAYALRRAGFDEPVIVEMLRKP